MLRNVIKLIWRHLLHYNSLIVFRIWNSANSHLISNEDFLIEKIKSKTSVLKEQNKNKHSVYSKTRGALLDPYTEQH